MTGLLFVIIIIAIALIALPIALTKNDSQQAHALKRPQKTVDELLEEAKTLKLLAEVKRQAEDAGDSATVQSVIDMKYKGEFPIEKPDGSYTSIYSYTLSYSIAGINYRKNIGHYIGGFFGYIKPEPTNAYDPNAIAIYHNDGNHLGYIPANLTSAVRQNCKTFPYPCFGSIESFIDDNDDDGPKDTIYAGTIILEFPHNSIQNLPH